MAKKPTQSIAVPPDELARQAEAALLGYGYQLYQTVLAWLSLRRDQLLHIEFAEDFAVSGASALELTQVKRTKASLTLRSKSVAALVRAVWTFQNANPERSVVAALISTGRIGKERGRVFPGKVPGLSYWRVAAREQADVEPMRQALLELSFPNDLKNFLKNASDEDLRLRILRPIRWLGSGPSQEEIEEELHERLVHLGDSLGVGAQDSKNALSALIVELLNTVRKPSASRFVTAADLLSVFQRNTYRLFPPRILQGTDTQQQGDFNDLYLVIRDTATVPLPPRAVRRPEITKNLHATLSKVGVLWLHGSSGLGKTTLALLLAGRQNTLWEFADLRGLEPRPLRQALLRISVAFGAGDARGIILDDLPGDVDNATLIAIRRVARAVSNADGVLVVTSSRSPPPTLADGLTLTPDAVRAVPYLTESDVGEVVNQAGGDAKIWSRSIYLYTGGHPQLVDARVMGLRQRGWPLAESNDLIPMRTKSGDLEGERLAVRTRLLKELDEGSRELLFRLSLLTNNFDREIMFALADVVPAVGQAGMLFDALLGPWIEQVGPERFRLSPLLRDSGEAAFSETRRAGLRTATVHHLIARRPFPADQLLQVFIFGFQLKLVTALTWFSGVLVQTASRDADTFKRLAEEVFIFAVVDRGAGQLLLPENVHVSAMLRYAQLRVALATNDGKQAAQVLDRLLFEIERLDGSIQSGFLSMALGTALSERSLPLRPQRWLNMLQTLAALPGFRSAAREAPAHTDPFSGLTLSISPEEMMFIIRATALKGIDELCEFIELIEALPIQTRDRYLAGAAKLPQTATHIVASAWLSAVRVEGFDAREAATKLASLYDKALRWNRGDLAVELACAQAVMLDEYAADREGALKVLSAAKERHPQDYRINRQRQKVYYRSGEHALALAEFESFANAFPTVSRVDRAFAMREAGRSATEIGELDKTRVFFGEAWKAAQESGEHMLPMRAGLSADCAILEFQAGRVENAIALMLQALEEAELIDPKRGLKEHYTILIITAAILWMRGAATDWPVERQAMVTGMCSNPDPSPELKERPLPQQLLPWYMLAELEAERSEGQLVLAALRRRTANGGLLPLETLLASRLVQVAVRTLNVDRFVELLPLYCRAVTEGVEIMKRRNYEAVSMPAGLLKPVTPAEWSESGVREAASSAILIFMIAAVCSQRGDAALDLRARLEVTRGASDSLRPMFESISHPSVAQDDTFAVVSSLVGRMRDPTFVFNAADAFMATVYLIQLLSKHTLGETAAGPVFKFFADVWRDILANRTFSVRNPAGTTPFILASLSKGTTNCAKLAHLVLASEAAVSRHLSPELKEQIRELTREPARKSLSDLQAPLYSRSAL